jgi:CheY-like chemotaxis protein
MPDAASPPLIAVVNNSEEVVELLRLALETEGFTHVTEAVLSFKRGQRDVVQFMAEHDPHGIVWDISLPYEENWEFFRGILDGGVLTGRGVVLTTTNKRVLEELVGPTATLELVGKPYDLDQLFGALRRALSREGYAAV